MQSTKLHEVSCQVVGHITPIFWTEKTLTLVSPERNNVQTCALHQLRVHIFIAVVHRLYSTRQKNGDVSVPFRLNVNSIRFRAVQNSKRRSMKQELNGNGTGPLYSSKAHMHVASQLHAVKSTTSQAVSFTKQLPATLEQSASRCSLQR